MTNKKKIGVILCGCGHRDGSEIHEATLALLAIDRNGGEAICSSPSGKQRIVRNHITAKDTYEERDMLVESARIARGRIIDLAKFKAVDIDALVMPGGQGMGMNLSTFLMDGSEHDVHPELLRLVGEMMEAKKPIGAICISPVILAIALSKLGVKAKLTIGNNKKVAAVIENLGHRHVECPPYESVLDEDNRIVTTPAYMSAKSIGELWLGIDRLVSIVIGMV